MLQKSSALATLMQGEFSESIADEAKWDDVDKRTFLRFTQFAYTGDYKLPPSIIDRSSPIFKGEMEQTEYIPQEVTVGDLEGCGGYSSKKDKERKGTLVLEWVLVPEPTFGVLCLRNLNYP